MRIPAAGRLRLRWGRLPGRAAAGFPVVPPPFPRLCGAARHMVARRVSAFPARQGCAVVPILPIASSGAPDHLVREIPELAAGAGAGRSVLRVSNNWNISSRRRPRPRT